MVTFNMDNGNNADLTLNVYNVTGVLVRSELLKQNELRISVGDLINGIYLVDLQSKDWSVKQRLIIQR